MRSPIEQAAEAGRKAYLRLARSGEAKDMTDAYNQGIRVAIAAYLRAEREHLNALPASDVRYGDVTVMLALDRMVDELEVKP